MDHFRTVGNICGGKTRLKKGLKGEFWGCIRYPDCKGIINNDTQKRKSARSSKAVKPKNN
jgi:DNA topoisomerase-3